MPVALDKLKRGKFQMSDETPVNEQGIKEVRELRIAIDANIQQLETTEGFGNSRSLALVKTKLEEAKMWAGKALVEEAKMWAGKALGEMGSELPAAYNDKAQLNKKA